jgi:tripartite-type tricarboxylate transporter receptor subunit TctC
VHRRTLLQCGAAAAFVPAVSLSRAQSDRPVSLVLGYAAGGTTDLIARIVATEMSLLLGRQVLVENIPGVSGMLAAQKVANGPADGRMIYMGGTDTVVVPMLNDKVKIQWERDFTPIGSSTYVSMILAVSSKSPYQSLTELIATLRKNKKDFTYATPGVGTMQHLYGSLIRERAKIPLVHVPYKGGAPIANDLIGGHVDSAVLTTTSALQYIKDGSIRAISVADSMRLASLPNVKTIGEEEGFSAVSMPLWHAYFVKAGTPPAVAAAYEGALLSAVGGAELQKRFRDAGATPWVQTGKDLTPYIRRQGEVFKDIIQSAKIVNE